MLAGVPSLRPIEPPAEKTFSDVLPDQYYTEAIKYSERWLRGYDNGLFGVEDPVTRSQLATVLMRYDGARLRGWDDRINREIREHESALRDFAALVCLNKRLYLDSVEINSLVPSALGDPEARYARALERLCKMNWQQEGDPTIDPYRFEECHDDVDVRTGQITAAFCYPQ